MPISRPTVPARPRAALWAAEALLGSGAFAAVAVDAPPFLVFILAAGADDQYAFGTEVDSR